MPTGEWLIAAGEVGGTHEGGSHIYRQGPGPKLPLYLNGQCMARAGEREVILAGGEGFSRAFREAFIMDWETKEWEPLPPMTYTHTYHACFVLGNNFYVVGGKGDDVFSESSEKLSLVDRIWSPGPKLPPGYSGEGPLWNPEVVYYRDTVLLIGGWERDGPSHSPRILELDLAENEFVVRPERLRVGTKLHTAVVLPDDDVPC